MLCAQSYPNPGKYLAKLILDEFKLMLIYPHFPMNEIASLAVQLTYHAIAALATREYI